MTGAAAMMRGGFEAGYELHPIQRLAAVATASKWRDAVVTRITPDGWIALVDLDTQAERSVWHYRSVGVGVGEPVSFHEQYNVLAVGRTLYSAALAA
jgi:hypothetical protein